MYTYIHTYMCIYIYIYIYRSAQTCTFAPFFHWEEESQSYIIKGI